MGYIKAYHIWGSCMDIQFHAKILIYKFKDHLMTRKKGVKP